MDYRSKQATFPAILDRRPCSPCLRLPVENLCARSKCKRSNANDPRNAGQVPRQQNGGGSVVGNQPEDAVQQTEQRNTTQGWINLSSHHTLCANLCSHHTPCDVQVLSLQMLSHHTECDDYYLKWALAAKNWRCRVLNRSECHRLDGRALDSRVYPVSQLSIPAAPRIKIDSLSQPFECRCSRLIRIARPDRQQTRRKCRIDW